MAVRPLTEVTLVFDPILLYISTARAFMYGRSFIDLMDCVSQLKEVEIVEGKPGLDYFNLCNHSL